MANFPTLAVQIAPGVNPGTVPTGGQWVDITPMVLRAKWQRGRSFELDRVQAGTLECTLLNNDRRFEPLFAAGAYYPNIKPMTWIRVQATWSATTYTLFTGYTRGWPQTYPNLVGQVRVTAVDGMRALSLAQLSSTVFVQQATGARVTAVLNALNWPASNRTIAAGASTVQAVTVAASAGLSHIEQVEDSEVGLFFVDGAGNAVFQDRNTRISMTTSAGTFGDDGLTELPYVNFEPDYDETNIWNDVRITRTGGVEQVGSDATSQLNYLLRTLVKAVLLVNDTDALNLANYLVSRYSSPQYRTKGVTFHPAGINNLWPHMLGRELSDRVTITRRPLPLGGAAISYDFFLEAVSHTVELADASISGWEVGWQLSPVTTQQYWVLGDTIAGVLGSTTRLSFGATTPPGGWSAPRTWVDAEVELVDWWNQYVRDNLAATMAGVVTAAGDLVYATAVNALARLAVGSTGQTVKVGAGGLPTWGGGSPLATLSYNPALTTINISAATLTAWDTTNLRITFTAPPSGKVEVRVSAWGTSDTTVSFAPVWGLLEGAATVGSTVSIGLDGPVSGGATQPLSRTTVAFFVSGLTPGTSHSYDLAAYSDGTHNASLVVGSGATDPGPAVMSVWAA